MLLQLDLFLQNTEWLPVLTSFLSIYKNTYGAIYSTARMVKINHLKAIAMPGLLAAFANKVLLEQCLAHLAEITTYGRDCMAHIAKIPSGLFQKEVADLCSAVWLRININLIYSPWQPLSYPF